jgi:hypothetical protein
MANEHEELEARVSALESMVRQRQAEIDRLKTANQVGRAAEAPRVTRTPTRSGYPKR